MRNTWKLIRRFVLILLLSVITLFILNVVLLIAYTYDDANNRGGWQAAEEIAKELTETKEGYRLSPCIHLL